MVRLPINNASGILLQPLMPNWKRVGGKIKSLNNNIILVRAHETVKINSNSHFFICQF
jgi:hypothetical protein